MKKKSILFVIALGICVAAKAQQVPFYSHYFFKPSVHNPAFTGDKENAEVLLISRSQFVGFEGAPNLNVLIADGKLMETKSYMGIFIADNRKGISNNLNAMANYAYRANFNEDKDVYMKFGIALGIFDQSIAFNKLLVQDYTDPFLFTNTQRRTTVDANAGLMLYAKGFSFGFSVPQVIGDNLSYGDN